MSLHPLLALPQDGPSIPVHCITVQDQSAIASLSGVAQTYLAATGFKAAAGKIAIAPGPDGAIEAVVFCTDDADRLAFGRLATALPAGRYHCGSLGTDPELATLAFLMGGYRFTRYKANTSEQPRLVLPDGVSAKRVSALAEAIAFGRDLINTPAADMGPEALGEVALTLARHAQASARMITGDALLNENFPMVHAVGRAAGTASAAQAPRLVDFTCGPDDGMRVTLVGKGVCFDTGGLNIKPESGMLTMKKDMGGAAIALSVARMITALELPVRLRVIVPIVENAIAGNAFRPGDILNSRKGLTVEIGNTDAEGRLILADALALAAEEPPELLINYATLTGAARVALGPDLPAMFVNNDALAHEMLAAGERVSDPVWRLPLWNAYDAMLESSVADVNHISGGGFAGSITAALFLRRFVPAAIPWAHIDTFAWRQTALPGRPAGGEPQAARLTLDLIEKKLAARV